MLAYGMADSAQLGILTKALNDYCARHSIACKDDGDRERIAVKVMCLFQQGIESLEQLTAELERVA